MNSTLRRLALAATLVVPLAQPSQAATALKTDADNRVEEVLVLGSRKGSHTEITENTEKLVSMPGSLGDPLGAITALPGVVTPAEGGAPAVRGSSPSDNRYYIDGLPAGYIFHDFNTSILDDNVIHDFQLFAAGFGAPYSNATGAIFDIRLRDPRHQDLSTRVNLSFLRAGIFLEGAATEQSAFYFSARQGMLQYLLSKEDKPNDDGIRIEAPPSDGDYQFKYVWDPSPQDQFTLTLAGANDGVEADVADTNNFTARNPDFAGLAKIDKGFDTQGARWQHTFASGGTSQLAVAQNNNTDTITWGDGYFFRTDFTNTLLRAAVSQPLGAHHVTLGSELNRYDYQYRVRTVLIVCTEFEPDCDLDRRGLIEGSRSVEVNYQMVYLTDNWQVTDALNLDLGLQQNHNDFTQEHFLHPRGALTWQMIKSLALTASAGRYDRFPDLDTVMPLVGNPELKSPQADHFTLGLKGDVAEHWNWSLEGYQKKLTQLPLALDKSQPDASLYYSNDIKGDAKGVEFMLNRERDDHWYGWMSLSWSQSERTNLRTGQTRTYNLDTPLVFNLVGNYQFNDAWSAGFRFSAKSGEANTKIIGVRENPNFPGRYVPVYGEAYQDRLPIYSRLDLRMEHKTQFWGYPGSFYVDVINALNHRNVTHVDLNYDEVNKTGALKLEETREMGILPSVGVSMTF
ncbi:MAG: iron transporter [Marinagarivorans sp.]